jgi:hypothetical protein
MKDIYEEMIEASQGIAASFPPPRFYAGCKEWLDLSRAVFSQEEPVLKCRELVHRVLKDDFGHGLEHAEKVAVEAGALAYTEGARLSLGDAERREAGVLVQIAGLLHDLRRGEKNHATSSALAARKILGEFSFSPENGSYIVEAIANHEAFVAPKKIDSPIGQVISDALYDSDKFRWGPDNFTITLWQMLRFSQASIVPLIRRFPKGMRGIAEIKDTFRTETGRTYGPEFIDLGLQIGEKIYEFLQERFAAELRTEKSDGETGR